MSHPNSILRFVTDDPAQANESIASMLRRLCLLLEQDMLFSSPEPADHIHQQIAEIFGDQEETPSECYSCKNYSHSPHLRCAVNPTRKTDQDCHQFELKALGWDSSEDNPANYSDWDDSENNSANYSEY
jgi:hypothetical protein